MQPAASAYEPTYETRQEVVLPIKFNSAFIRDKHGILKIVEIVLTIIVFICVGSSWSFGVHGAGGWINFTAALSLIFSVFFFIIFLFNFIHRLPGPWVLIDFVVQAVLCFLMTISLIVAAASSHYGGSAISAAIFCAILAVTYAVECAIRFSIYRQNNQLIVSTKGVTSTGPNFQAAGADHTVPQTGPGMSPYPTDTYGMP
uniref:MARVEL domain-containing protein n=1 Tax=Schistocephalus solidus TaxID=70667 RepID=A0A0X3P3X6_SCHSO